MPFLFNPITGNLDLVNSSTGGPVAADQVSYDNSGSGLSANNVQDAIDELAASSSINYSQSFNATTDWTLASPVYRITINEATHLKGVNPIVEIFELNAGVYSLVNTDVNVTTLGNLTIQVTSSPDLRFAGKVVIS